MTERGRDAHGSTVGGLHLQVSRLLLVALIAAVAATGALVITLAVGLPAAHPPGPPPGTPGGQMPPPPDLRALAVVPVITGLFVLAWLSVIVAFSRDQILRRIDQRGTAAGAGPGDRQVGELFAELRAQLAADRERELQTLEARIAELTTEYGEQRETDGYLHGMRVATAEEHGMRVATADEHGGATVRALRSTPPPR